MKRIFKIQQIPATVLILCVMLVFFLFLLPPEKSLGHVIKAVFIHAAMIRCGLLALAGAGVFGVFDIIRHSQRSFLFCRSAQYTALALWILYLISSVLVTYLAWGIPIAWAEPRTQVSLLILFVLLLSFLITQLLNHYLIIDFINIFLALFSWIAVKKAINIRHPFDPIGSSDVLLYKISHLIILFVLVTISVQTIRFFYNRLQSNNKLFH